MCTVYRISHPVVIDQIARFVVVDTQGIVRPARQTSSARSGASRLQLAGLAPSPFGSSSTNRYVTRRRHS